LENQNQKNKKIKMAMSKGGREEGGDPIGRKATVASN
jgi:hypothetical protein